MIARSVSNSSRHFVSRRRTASTVGFFLLIVCALNKRFV
jgi:hypothetical protein